MNCQVVDCKNPAKWYVGFKLWPVGANRVTGGAALSISMSMKLSVCEDHKITPPHPAKDLFNTESRERLAEALTRSGMGAPDFDAIEYDYKLMPEEALA